MPKTKQFNEDLVLQKAKNVFWQKGYHGTSIDELVKATGLSRSSIYDSFTDKYHLFLRTLSHYQQQEQAILFSQVPPQLSPTKKIAWLFDNNIKSSMQDEHRKGCYLLNTTTELANVDEQVQNLLAANMEALEQVLCKWVKEGQNDGSITKAFTSKALARHLYCSFNGMKIIGQTKADKAILQDVMKVALAVLQP
jgi:TetR/AcrR family transcriptional regulator, transcriptional repressor for nem operon